MLKGVIPMLPTPFDVNKDIIFDDISSLIENQIEKHCANGGLCILTTHQDCNIKSLKEISL